MEKALKIKQLKPLSKRKQNKIKKPTNNFSDTCNIDAIIDEFISSFDEPNTQKNQPNIMLQSNDKVNLQMTPVVSSQVQQPVYSSQVPQPVYSIIDESKYDLEHDSNDYESNLLLAYNYFITPKTILSIGFAPHINFNSVAMLKQNNMEIVFDLLLWKKVMESTIIIEQSFMYKTSKSEIPFFEHELTEIKDSIKNSNIKIYFTVDRQYNGKIIIYQNKSKIILDLVAWRKLYLLEYLVQCILYNNKNVDENIRQYYSQYIERCVENQIFILLKNDLMTPTLKNHNIWNYERFFCELPVLCPKKLKHDIQKKI